MAASQELRIKEKGNAQSYRIGPNIETVLNTRLSARSEVMNSIMFQSLNTKASQYL